uniref:Ig-like domain-containing protein n=1 Tax=Magallana gigas TaxID=29159 RepID=K1PS03_MAGGI
MRGSTIGKNTGLGKRDVTNCYECCPETNHTLTTPPCNAKLCGIHERSEPKCYMCDDVIQPENCRTTGYCDLDEQCFTEKLTNHATGEIRYKLGCQRKALLGPQLGVGPNGITLGNQTSLTLTADVTSFGAYTCTATNINGFVTAKGYISPIACIPTPELNIVSLNQTLGCLRKSPTSREPLLVVGY